ncbi:unnamed protein product [Paramecium octaurelia]|uniref:Methenyltetrahydrofolate cyclohydrolase n=1 Tax=Paramecium octaurelia TaxID=43137 RepID=A0A8S1UI49_PAROT|nr:unnamed protein product [Paramecium octaurelia]CAD8164500.1 unnamed protein product [Paramecium octaurelia]
MRPGLAIIQVGNNPSSLTYVRKKIALCEEHQIHHELYHFPETISQKEIVHRIKILNQKGSIDGILVQLPLPSHLSRLEISNEIKLSKDVDCLHMANFQNLLQNGEDNDIIPCTPAAVLHILDTQDIDVRNQNVTVIGRSQLVGFPLSVLLLKRNARVTICHSETLVQEHVENADIVISCAGHKELVKGEWIKIGAKVIDVGITRIPGTNKIIGDIEFQKALPRVSFITPVPGGVGPLTVSMLFRNLYRVWCRSNGLKANVDEEEDEFDYAQNYQF